MVSQLVSTTFLCLIGWMFWKVVRPLIIPSPLDDIPGPESPSFVTGKPFKHCVITFIE